MNLWTILIIILILCAFGGGFGGFYPRSYGFGGGGLLILILILVIVFGGIQVLRGNAVSAHWLLILVSFIFALGALIPWRPPAALTRVPWWNLSWLFFVAAWLVLGGQL